MGIAPLPRKVDFDGRTGKERFIGEVIKEVCVDDPSVEGDFKKLCQLIKRNNGTIWIRFGYYFKDSGTAESKFMWGSQTSFIIPFDLGHELFLKAIKEKIIDIEQLNLTNKK